MGGGAKISYFGQIFIPASDRICRIYTCSEISRSIDNGYRVAYNVRIPCPKLGHLTVKLNSEFVCGNFFFATIANGLSGLK